MATNYSMEAVIRFNAQTSGRDKLLRSRLVWALLDKNEANRDSITRFKDLENSFSSSRKLLRLGRSIDVMHSATQTMHLPDPTLRLSLTFSRIANSLYLLCDHMVWIGRAGLIGIDKKKWSDWSNKFWLYSITMSLIRDIYEIMNLLKLNANTTAPKQCFGHSSRIDVIPGRDLFASRNQYMRAIDWMVRHKNICMDTLKNFCDLWLPMSALGHTKLSAQSVALLGMVSSVIAILQILDYSYRLSPN